MSDPPCTVCTIAEYECTSAQRQAEPGCPFKVLPRFLLCAGCGREIDTDTFGLCAECEDHIQQADSAWQPKPEEM